MLASIAGASGTLEERDAQIDRSGFYGEYPAILDAYHALFDDPDAGLEALKRALFIAWYGGVAPPCLSAIRDVPERALRATMTELEMRLRHGASDVELRWMLAWYRGASPWLFEVYGGAAAVGDFVGEMPIDAWRSPRPEPGTLLNRGQMGQYWRALVQGRLEAGGSR